VEGDTEESPDKLTVIRYGVGVGDMDTVELNVNVSVFISVADITLVPEGLEVLDSELPTEKVAMDIVTKEDTDVVEEPEIVDDIHVEGDIMGELDVVDETDREAVPVKLAKELTEEVDEKEFVPVSDAVCELEDVPEVQAEREEVVVGDKVVDRVNAPMLFDPWNGVGLENVEAETVEV